MSREIEHKFLVDVARWDPGDIVPLEIRQGYLSTAAGRVVRVRVAGDAAWVTIKGVDRGIERAEYEYPIPPGDAREILERICVKPIIAKRRYRVPYHGKTWDVDVFEGDNAGLTIAEIELDAVDEAFDRPPWLGEDVSGDTRYRNASLVAHPWREWGR